MLYIIPIWYNKKHKAVYRLVGGHKRNMKYIINILILLLLSTSGFGQIRKKDLIGEWQTKNDDSLYYKKDTITLFENINYLYDTKTCYLIRWTLNKRTFKIDITNRMKS